MVDAKPCDTPCLSYHRLFKDDGEHYSNPKLYRNIVGALQYLTFTKRDIAFFVHQVMQNPMVSHFTAIKRILQYLKGTMHFGISYTRGDLRLKAFSDADWAGDPNYRRSTTGLVVFLGNNPISWYSKKQQTVSSFQIINIINIHISLPYVPVLFVIICLQLPYLLILFSTKRPTT